MNTALRFLLEIALLIAIGYGAFNIGNSFFTRLLFCIGFLTIVIIIWGTFGSPNAPFALQGFYRLPLELAILGVAIILVWNIIHPAVIILFAAVFILNSFFLFTFALK